MTEVDAENAGPRPDRGEVRTARHRRHRRLGGRPAGAPRDRPPPPRESAGCRPRRRSPVAGRAQLHADDPRPANAAAHDHGGGPRADRARQDLRRAARPAHARRGRAHPAEPRPARKRAPAGDRPPVPDRGTPLRAPRRGRRPLREPERRDGRAEGDRRPRRHHRRPGSVRRAPPRHAGERDRGSRAAPRPAGGGDRRSGRAARRRACAVSVSGRPGCHAGRARRAASSRT